MNTGLDRGLLTELSRVGFDMFYKLEKQADEKDVIVAVAKTGMICYNYQLKKIAKVPVGVKEKLTG
jgi:acyl-CoA thioesterase FadM